MRTLPFTVMHSLAGTVLAVGLSWTSLGAEGASRVAMAAVARRGALPDSVLTPTAKPTDDRPLWARVSVAQLNVRWGPGLQHGIVTILRGGDFVRVMDRANGWLRIEWPKSAPAWVSSDWVQPDGRVTGRRVRVRAGGGTSATVLAELNRNDHVEILETVGNWHKIKVPSNVNASAFISARCAIVGVAPPDRVVHPEGVGSIPSVAEGPSRVSVKPVSRPELPPSPDAVVAPQPEVTPSLPEPSVRVPESSSATLPASANRPPTISFVRVVTEETPEGLWTEPVSPPPAAPVPIPPVTSISTREDDLEGEDPERNVRTPDASKRGDLGTHEAMLALVEKIPAAALVKPLAQEPSCVVVSEGVRASVDWDEFGALLPPPRFVRDRAETQEVAPSSNRGLTQWGAGPRAAAPLVFRLPGGADANATYIFLNGRLRVDASPPSGRRYKLIAGGCTLDLRPDAGLVDLDVYRDRQVEVLARCSSIDSELIVSALHPLD